MIFYFCVHDVVGLVACIAFTHSYNNRKLALP